MNYMTRELLIGFAYKHRDNWEKLVEVLKEFTNRTTGATDEELEYSKKICELVDKKKVKVLTVVDEEYPAILTAMEYTPFVVFYSGNINLLNETNIIGIGDNVSPKKVRESGACYFAKNLICKEKGTGLGIEDIDEPTDFLMIHFMKPEILNELRGTISKRMVVSSSDPYLESYQAIGSKYQKPVDVA